MQCAPAALPSACRYGAEPVDAQTVVAPVDEVAVADGEVPADEEVPAHGEWRPAALH